MSVDTNLYVRVTEESKLKVLQTVNKAVKEWYLAGKRKAHKESKYSDKSMLCWMFRDEVKPLWKGVERHTSNFETFNINYKFNGEHRTIFLCFSHSKKDEIGDFEKLYVSLGMSGDTRLPVFGAIIEALREAKYEQWFINNDCDDNTPPHFVDDNFKISDYE